VLLGGKAVCCDLVSPGAVGIVCTQIGAVRPPNRPRTFAPEVIGFGNVTVIPLFTCLDLLAIVVAKIGNDLERVALNNRPRFLGYNARVGRDLGPYLLSCVTIR